MEVGVKIDAVSEGLMAATTPGESALPVTISKYRVRARRAKRQRSPSSFRLTRINNFFTET
jgi:hypothetical protein